MFLPVTKKDLEKRYNDDVENYIHAFNATLDLEGYTKEKILADLKSIERHYYDDMFEYDSIAALSRFIERCIATNSIEQIWYVALKGADYCTFIKLCNTAEAKFINDNYAKLADIRIAMLAEAEEVLGLFEDMDKEEVIDDDNEI